MNEKKIKIDSNTIFFVSLFLYLYLTNIAPHSIFSKIGLFLFLIISFFRVLFARKLKINYYFILYIVFFAINLIGLFLDIYPNSNSVYDMLKTLILNYIFLLLIYCNLRIEDNFNRWSRIYIFSSALSLVTIMFICRSNLFTSRLAHSWGKDSVSYYLLGHPIAMSSNMIGFFSATSILLCIYFFSRNKQKNNIFLIILFILGIALTGSRKTFLVLIIYIIFAIFQYSKNKSFLLNFIKVLFVGIILIIAIIKIPYLYNMLGKRLESLLRYISSSTVDESSIAMRNYLKDNAIKMFYLKPFWGYGLGYFETIYDNVVENNFLELLVGTGIVGTIFYYLYLIPSIFRFIKIKNKSLTLKTIFIIFLAVLFIEFGSSIYIERGYMIFIPVLIYTIEKYHFKRKKMILDE